MRIRTAKKVLSSWPIYRLSTRDKAFRVMEPKLTLEARVRLWQGIRMMRDITKKCACGKRCNITGYCDDCLGG